MRNAIVEGRTPMGRLLRAALQLAETRRQRDELRAILAPLLDNPIPAPITRCVHCERRIFERDPWGADGNGVYDPRYHTDDCPVLRRDEILGRG